MRKVVNLKSLEWRSGGGKYGITAEMKSGGFSEHRVQKKVEASGTGGGNRSGA